MVVISFGDSNGRSSQNDLLASEQLAHPSASPRSGADFGGDFQFAPQVVIETAEMLVFHSSFSQLLFTVPARTERSTGEREQNSGTETLHLLTRVPWRLQSRKVSQH